MTTATGRPKRVIRATAKKLANSYLANSDAPKDANGNAPNGRLPQATWHSFMACVYTKEQGTENIPIPTSFKQARESPH